MPTFTPSNTAALYLRAADADDVDAELDLLRATAAAHELDVDTILDVGTFERMPPGLAELIRSIEAGRITTVVCAAPAPPELISIVELIHPRPPPEPEEVN